jgi:CHAT domain-containing protein
LTEERYFLEKGFRCVESREDVLVALRSAQVLHFCGHGRFRRASAGELPCFFLSDGASLSLEDLQTETDFGRLITISACQLGGTVQVDGNLLGMPGFLLQKNVRAVLAHGSLLDARVAGIFFPAFYNEYLAGTRVGEAAVRALGTYQVGQQGTRDLGLWAPFSLFGDQWATIDEIEAQ